MARLRPPIERMKTILEEQGRMKRDGYIRSWKETAPKRIYIREDGQFVGIGWRISFFIDMDTRETESTVILDSQLNSP